jgi:subtilisin family serine protease
MGNSRQGGSPTSYPAAISGVIAVGATNIDDTVANFSNRGNHISIAAPGVGIWSTLPTYAGQFGFAAAPGPNGQPVIGAPQRRETGYDAWNGTSMASPHVAAAVALLLATKGAMSPAIARRRLMQSADRVADMTGINHHPDFGAGRLNLLRLLQ